MALGLAAALALGAGAPLPYFWLSLTCISIVYLTMLDDVLGVCLVLLLNPMLFIVRNAAPASIVLAGAQTEWIICLFVGWLFKKEARLPQGLDVVLMYVFCFYLLVSTVVSENLVQGLLGLRSIFIPILIYFVVRDIVNRKPTAVFPISASIIGTGGILGALSILWLLGYIDVAVFFSKGALLLGGDRNVFGTSFERLGSLIGGGPSNAGLYMGSGIIMFIGLLLSKSVPKLHVAFFFCLAAIGAYASFLTLSRSVILLLTISFFIIFLATNTRTFVKLLLLPILAVSVFEIIIGDSFADISIYDSMKNTTFIYARAMPNTLTEIIFGTGLNAASGGLLGRDTGGALPIDGGWALLFAMVGCIGFFPLIIFLLMAAVRLKNLMSYEIQTKETTLGVFAGATAAGLLLGSVHMAVIMRPAIDIVFYVLTASMISISYHNVPAPLADGDNFHKDE